MKKSKEERAIIDNEIVDAILELPHQFSVDEEKFFIYPLTLGKSFLLDRAIQMLNMNKVMLAIDSNMEALRLSYLHKKEMCIVIAYHTFKDKEDLVDEYKIDERATFFEKNIDEEDLAKLFIIVSKPVPYDEFITHFGIDEEKKWQRKAMQAKKDSDALTFGGKSIYGTLIDFACERYGWTYDYVVWGVSYINLQMLMADVVNTMYLSEKERKKARIPKDRTRISADQNRNALKEFLG